jgi:hypothetical protein
MPPLTPLRTGAAFALTVAILYLACLVVMLISPGTVLAIFATWVHGLNLEPLTTNPPPIQAPRALVGLLLISGYAFITGAVYGVIRQWLTPRSASSRESTRVP